MRTIPGIKIIGSRMSPVPMTEVQCQCGRVVARLVDGETISMRGAPVVRTVQGQCPACGEAFRVPIGAEK